MTDRHHFVLIADTHVGDRTDRIAPELLDAIRDENPDAILHAGDICVPDVIRILGEIAPVHAVQGNRDWFMGYRPPMDIHLEINGVNITLAHGHVSMLQWAWNYFQLFFLFRMNDHRYFQRQLARAYPNADVIVYGHIHYQYDEAMDGQRFINPGVAYPEARNRYHPRYATLDILPNGTVEVQLKSVSPAQDSV